MDLALWIGDYATYLKSNGYVSHAVDIRLKRLYSLNRFVEARGLKTLEEFPPEWASDFIDYWKPQILPKTLKSVILLRERSMQAW